MFLMSQYGFETTYDSAIQLSTLQQELVLAPRRVVRPAARGEAGRPTPYLV